MRKELTALVLGTTLFLESNSARAFPVSPLSIHKPRNNDPIVKYVKSLDNDSIGMLGLLGAGALYGLIAAYESQENRRKK